MKSNVKLQSAVFQLTPTRTRYDLFIVAHEKKEKIASGLLLPFIAHLKTAEDQIAKGGYSIVLEPEDGTDTAWFTKDTVERFVRFVSTPEILERVYTTELAIRQIDEAIAIQGNSDIGVCTIEEHPSKTGVSNEGSKASEDDIEENAIVLFTPGGSLAKVDGSIAFAGKSNTQLLKVLETRKTMLQKERGMGFARAAAAGFAVENLAPLVSFAERFGASRLMDACLRFTDVWKRKRESGKCVKIDEAEAIYTKSNFSTPVNHHRQEVHVGSAPESNAEAVAKEGVDERSSSSYQMQIANPMFPTWPANSPPGSLPDLQAYPIQRVLFHQDYPHYQPHFSPSEDIQYNRSGNSNLLSEKSGKSGKRKSAKIVTKQKDSSPSESISASDSDPQIDRDTSKNLRVSERKGIQLKLAPDQINVHGEEKMINGKETDSGHWQAFQTCLLRATDKSDRVTNDDISGGKIVRKKSAKDDFPFGRQENQSNSSHQLDLNGLEGTTYNLNKTLSQGVADESFIVPFREMSSNDKITNIEMGPEISSNRVENQVNYEPYDLCFVSQHGSDKRPVVYDPALDYDLRFGVKGASQGKRNKEAVTDVKDQRSNGVPDKKSSGGPIRKGKVSKMSPLDEARARAESLRSYKANLQKIKKEKEEAEKKRLDTLKLERQKRIAARGQTLPSLQTRKSLPTKLTPISNKGSSKFSDSEPKSSSPLQRSKIRTASLGSIDFQSASKVTKSSDERSKLRPASLGSIDFQKSSKVAKSSNQKAKLRPTSPLQRSKIRTASLGSIDFQSASKVTKSSDERSKLRPASLGSIDFQKASKVAESSNQKAKLRPTSLGSVDSEKTSKVRKSSDERAELGTASLGSFDSQKKYTVSKTSDTKGNGLTRSALSLSESKFSMPRNRRLSDPKVINSSSTIGGPVVKKTPTGRDVSQSTTLSKLKSKALKRADSFGHNKSTAKEMKSSEYKTYKTHTAEHPVVDKSIVTLEYEPAAIEDNKCKFDSGEKIDVVSDAIPLTVDGERIQEQAITSHKGKESIKFSSSNIAQKPLRAPKTSIETASKGAEPARAHVPDLNKKREKNPEALEKPASVKEPSKGIKRLLKLGRRAHTSAAVDRTGIPNNPRASGEGQTLKNLISQEEEPSAGHTPEKSSRHFSFLPPFRSKSSEKKLII